MSLYNLEHAIIASDPKAHHVANTPLVVTPRWREGSCRETATRTTRHRYRSRIDSLFREAPPSRALHRAGGHRAWLQLSFQLTSGGCDRFSLAHALSPFSSPHPPFFPPSSSFSLRAPFLPATTSTFFPLNCLSRAPRDSATAVVSLLFFASAVPPPPLALPPHPLADPTHSSSEVRIVHRRRARMVGERPTSVNQFRIASFARLFGTFRVTENARRLK